MRNKSEIEYHQLGYGYTRRVPAVNVKVYESISSGFKKWAKDNPDKDARFTEEWIAEHVSDELGERHFQWACEDGWEQLQQRAEEIYGKHVKVYSEGRSGGWAYIHGMDTDVESWDAIEFGQWRSFSKFAKEVASGIMYSVVENIYHNMFEAWANEQSELAAPEIPEGVTAWIAA